MNNIKSVFIRKRNNNYNVYVEYLDSETGKIKQKSHGKYSSKKDAEKHLIEIKNSVNGNKFVISKDITFVERCQKYMDDDSKDFSPVTLSTRSVVLNSTIKPFFKDIQLQDITPSVLQAFANYVYKNHTKQSARVRLAFVKAVLNEAYRLREITDNPTHFIKTPKSLVADARIPDVYSKEEVKEVIDKLEGSIIEIPILLMLTLGLRCGEACGLRWEDVDFENNLISINKTLTYVNKTGFIYKDPKTKGSIRTISAPAELMLKLKKLKVKYNKLKLENILEGKSQNLVCLNSILNPYSEPTLLKAWYKFLENNNIKRITLHDLRHTHATLLILAGTDMKTVSDRLGHTDIKITMNRYSHVLEEMDRKASDNISNIMFK
ncbi:integrase [[Clostridium] sordellii]|uniref:Integrase n=1 Tax=Paraclostridium sordellii TaxID=1505 RepID=A0ABM9RQE1_PARSO|nr:tyrosine-type recombinase/integrase [Paeniclostridium sordellii]CEJ74263.1 Integrase [[Clostridium] sordellii] [Paeniclostridium sordellii]CEN69805.1 integrase [[Clostridium] sordellii] [Paeniclostridium sordellii]CEN73073.1 integrase [[Clostridium] sordellii] [Paeniclostridium sordellii]CEO25705.1 integrase [[Clostridium] sordellii] [Paeniclostridium sordellii]CEP75334.1 integrase [[Clostridium] sordellii] [Paeniclostridium sordellii]